MLIVSVPSVTNNIYENIFMELLSILEGNMHSFVDELGLVSIDMNNWCLNRFGNISTVKASSSFCWGRRKSNLVIGYDMNNSVRLIMGQVAHLQAFVHDTLPGHCSVTVDQDAQGFGAVLK